MLAVCQRPAQSSFCPARAASAQSEWLTLALPRHLGKGEAPSGTVLACQEQMTKATWRLGTLILYSTEPTYFFEQVIFCCCTWVCRYICVIDMHVYTNVYGAPITMSGGCRSSGTAYISFGDGVFSLAWCSPGARLDGLSPQCWITRVLQHTSRHVLGESNSDLQACKARSFNTPGL